MTTRLGSPRPERIDLELSRDIQATRLGFVALCLYLFSQCFEIPLAPIGPSWAVWPVLSDLATGLLLLAFLTSRKRLWIRHKANEDIFRLFAFAVGALTVAFLLSSLRSALSEVGEAQRATAFGVFQIYRLLQFLLVFRMAAGIPLSPERVSVLTRLVSITLVLVFAGIVGTYTGFLPTPLLVSHLPSDINRAGPWISMANGQWFEAGTIGYNHSYTSVQILMLGGLVLALHLRRRSAVLEALYLSMATVGVFLTGSRAGMAAAAIFVIAMFARRPASALAALVVFVLMFSMFSGWIGDADIGLSATVERQLTLGRAADPENLSGRADIWKDSIALLQEDPVRWVIGIGPGFIAQSGNNAHMLILHIIIEGGLIGLIIFSLVMWRILQALWRLEPFGRPIFWTSIALLASSLTQETLYPVPAMGHFLGFYLCSVALAISVSAQARSQSNKHEVRECVSA